MSLIFRRWHEVAVKLLWGAILLHYRLHQVPQKHSLCRMHTKGSQMHLLHLKGSQGPSLQNWDPCWLNSVILWETGVPSVHPQYAYWEWLHVQPETFQRFHCFTPFFYLSNTWQSILDHTTSNSTTARLSYLSVRRLNVVQTSAFQIMSSSNILRFSNIFRSDMKRHKAKALEAKTCQDTKFQMRFCKTKWGHWHLGRNIRQLSAWGWTTQLATTCPWRCKRFMMRLCLGAYLVSLCMQLLKLKNS